MKKTIVVAIDGPAGSGKSTVSKLVAAKLGFDYIETGAIYRSVAFLAQQNGMSKDDVNGLIKIIESMDLKFKFQNNINLKIVNKIDRTKELYTPEISFLASTIAAIPQVRQALISFQQNFAKKDIKGIILEGRDIGTIIFPDADYKFFITATPEERARRRMLEYKQKGEQHDFKTILKEIIKRDQQDSNRKVAPLKAAPDAIVIITDNLSINEVVQKIIDKIT